MSAPQRKKLTSSSASTSNTKKSTVAAPSRSPVESRPATNKKSKKQVTEVAPEPEQAPYRSLGAVLRSVQYTEDVSQLKYDNVFTDIIAWFFNHLMSKLYIMSQSGATSYKMLIDFDQMTCSIHDDRGIAESSVFALKESDVDLLQCVQDDEDAFLLSKLCTRVWEAQTDIMVVNTEEIEITDDEGEDQEGETDEDDQEGEGQDEGDSGDAVQEVAGEEELDNEGAAEPQEEEEEEEDDEMLMMNPDEDDDDDIDHFDHGIILRIFLN
jgi:hypothetical protein